MGRRSAAAALALALGPAAAGASPALDYVLHCQGCHLGDGSATPGRVPALRGALAPFTRSAAGRAYLVRVPGVATAPVSDAALAALLNWTVERFDGAAAGADFRPFTGEEVARVRRPPLTDVSAERRRVLTAQQEGAP